MGNDSMVNEKNVELSIIVPVYNVEKYLEQCLESLLNQTYKNIEIIVVNDGSTDQSLDILKKYSFKDNRIKLYSQKNQGISAARNTALEHINGKYVMFVDSDDWIEINTCEIALHEMKKNDSDIVMWAYRREYLNKKNITFNPTRTSEDYSFNHLCVFGTYNFAAIDEVVYIYKDNKKSLTKGIDLTKTIDNLVDFVDNIIYVMDHVDNRFSQKVVAFFLDSYFYVFKNYEYYKSQGEEERMITLLQKLEDKGKIYDEETISKVAPAFSFINFKNTLN